MIENVNASKMPSNGEFVDVKKYIGVASVNVLAVNPTNATLRKYGWNIADGADEPQYVMTGTDGRTSARVRFLVQIQDFDDKPVVSLDFWVRPENWINKDQTKCKIIDAYGRTAWATREEIKSKSIPQYPSGPANISNVYTPCHPGQEEIVQFLLKYLNVTPLQTFDSRNNMWVPTKNPGRLTIDNWKDLCAGDASEIAEYLSLQPENRVKVILGVRTTEENRAYQTFLNTAFMGNGSKPDITGEYKVARKAIDKYFEADRDLSNFSFSASPVKEWKESATDVTDNSGTMFDKDGNFVADDDSDLPFD